VRAGARRVLTSLRVVASGREVAKRLVQVVPPQQFEVSIQAAIGAKVVAKERIRGMKKDVLVKSGKTVGGGDVTRKLKLLEKQKRGKLKLKSVGSVVLNDEAFMAVLDRRGNL
jgi:GTP-binding protein LepA